MNRNELINGILEHMNLTKRGLSGHIRRLMDNLPVSPAQLELLVMIQLHQPITAKVLAHNQQLTAGAISQLTDILEQKRLIIRRRETEDRRSYVLTTSTSGDELLTTIQKRREQLFKRVMRNFSEEELTVWLRIQQKIIHELETEKAAQSANQQTGTL